MKYVLLMIVVVNGFCGQIFGSEKKEEIVRCDLKFDTEYQPLYYSDKKYIDFLNENYGMGCHSSEPFVQLDRTWVPKSKMSLEEQLIKKITLMPFKYFINGDFIEGEGDNNTFKQQGDMLFSFSQVINDQKKQFHFISDMDFGVVSPKEFLQRFKKQFKCMLGHILGEDGKMLVLVDTDALEKELFAAGICEVIQDHNGERYVHGPNSFFENKSREVVLIKENKIILTETQKTDLTEEQKLKQEEIEFAKTILQRQQKVLFYKKILGYGSIAAAMIFMYFMYQKLYATAG